MTELLISGCKKEVHAIINQRDLYNQAAMSQGANFVGLCPVLKKQVEFNVGSLCGVPINSICTTLHCRHHTRPEEI